MRLETLLYPGSPSNGFMLRNEACKAISAIEIVAGRTPGGRIQAAKTLADFFTDCASKLSTLYESVVPTVSTRVAASATQINITYSETMDQTVTPPLSAFGLPSPDTITAVAWVSATVLRLTGTGFASGESLVYTQPATSYVRDLAGNAVASNTANLT